MTVHPLRPATRHRLGRPSPHQQADRPRAHPPPKTPKGASFPGPPCDRPRISRISHTFMRLSRRRGQVTHVLLTRSPLIQNQQADPFTVRLACVKHAASVRPEPGSNSPNKTNKTRPQPTTNKQPARTHSQYNSPENQTRPNPTPQQRGPGKPKQNKTPKTTHNQNHAQPPGPWHKKHDTLSSSQTTHPAGTQSSLLTQLRSGEQLRYSRTFVGSTSTSGALFPVTPIDVLL